MKTIEEVAWQIIREGLDPDWEAIDMKKITAIIRADREDVYKAGVVAGKALAAAALAKAREEGRRDGLEGVRKIMTYDETATSRGLGQGNTWDVIKRTYTIDADVFDALLAEGKKEQIDE